MRAICELPTEFQDWFKGGDSIKVRNFVLRDLSTKSALTWTKADCVNFADSASISGDCDKSYAEILIHKCLTLGARTQVDYSQISNSAESEIDVADFISSDEFASLVAKRQEIIKSTEAPIDAYKRLLEPFVQAASTVRIIDKYSFQNLLNEDSGASWLLDQILKDSKSNLDVFGSVDAINQDRFHKKVHVLKDLHLTLNRQYPGRIKFKAFSDTPSYQFPHERYIRLSFPRDKQLCAILGKGMEVFDPTSAGAAFNVNEINSNDFKHQLENFKLLNEIQL